jgi:hypothetical protein
MGLFFEPTRYFHTVFNTTVENSQEELTGWIMFRRNVARELPSRHAEISPKFL